MPARLRTTGPLLVRASTAPTDLPIPSALDPDHDPITEVTAWVRRAWSRADVRDTVAVASPDLAQRLTSVVSAEIVEPRAARRAARSLAAYLVRWQRRCTPFGLFAGVTTATVGTPVTAVVHGARAVARPDAEWLRLTGDFLARQPAARDHLIVTANPLAVERDGRLLLEPRLVGDDPGARLREVSVRATSLVRAALDAAREPVRLADLTEHLTAATSASAAQRARLILLLAALVRQGFLVTSAAPSSTTDDGLVPFATLAIATVDAANTTLAMVRDVLDRHNTTRGSDGAARRTQATDLMRTITPQASTLLAVDTRLNATLTVPPVVVEEAERAASVLLRLSSEPFGAVRWLDYHARFRARYGAGALVPVKDLVADAGLGYPTGFLGSPRTRPAWRQVTDRDAVVLNLLHCAALDGTDEVVLSDDDVDALTVGDPDAVVPPARCELGFAIHTPSSQALGRGDFLLRVTAAPEACTSMTGRFAHLLDAADRDRLTGYFTALGQAADGPVVAQLVFRPRRERADNVVRVPVLTDHVIVLDEHHDGPQERIGVDDLAVTADVSQMYLVQTSTGRRVVPVIPHALELTSRTPPLVRFLAEVADARSAVFRPFDLGAARTLDHTPRLRYRRTILAPARWVLHTEHLTGPGSWLDRFDTWRIRHRVPARVVLADGGTHLPLDLDQPLDRRLLERAAAGANHVELHEDIPDGDGWLGRPAEVLAPMAPERPPARRPPVTVPVPGRGGLLADGFLTVRLAGSPARFDQLVTDHLPRLAETIARARPRRWWFTRLRDLILPERDQYLQVTVQLDDRVSAAAALPFVTAFLEDLAAAGLPCEASLHPHHPHHGVYGGGQVLDAAYEVFTADTLAAVEQTRLARKGGLPAQALAAASYVTLARGLAGDDGRHLVLETVPREPGPLGRELVETACWLADPADDHKHLRAAGGDAVADAWARRHGALTAYRDLLTADDRDPGDVLWPLWREHHARTLGVDADLERSTRLTARRAAQRLAALEAR